MIGTHGTLRFVSSSILIAGLGAAFGCSSKASPINSGSGGNSPAAGAAGETNAANGGSEASVPATGAAGETNVASGGTSATGDSTSATGGTTSATGGSYTNTNAGASQHGYQPTTITSDAADTAYAAWKASYLEDCGSGVWRVKWSNATLTVSEGIAYGMLLTVIHDEQAIFDGLWQYYKNNLDANGLMHWQRSGCAGTAYGNNAATDAELDAAMALVMASRRWSTTPYLDDAKSLIGLIQRFETTTSSSGLSLLKPGDMFGGPSCLNFSYFAPGYYRVFAEVVPDQAAFWNKLADDSYTLINRVAHVTTALVPNWCDENGVSAAAGPAGCAYYTNANLYGSDAARTPWRIATDYVWYGTPQAQAWLNKLTSWVKTVGIANVVNLYQLDGTAAGANHTVVVVGAFADAAMAYDQATVDEFFNEVVTMAPQTTYFPSSLRALYTLLPLGRFTPEGGP